jgi:hypothetical protein
MARHRVKGLVLEREESVWPTVVTVVIVLIIIGAAIG